MLDLADFLHLPELDAAITRIAVDGSGLIVVAGLDPAVAPAGDSVLSSGRATFMRVLMRELLQADPQTHAIVVCESRGSIRIPRQLRHRVTLLDAESTHAPITQRLSMAAARQPALLVLERLEPETVLLAVEIARAGVKVLTQYETVFSGPDVVRALADAAIGATTDLSTLDALHWVIAVQRVPALCANCSTEIAPSATEQQELRLRFGGLLDQFGAEGQSIFRRAGGCAQCSGRGYEGEVALFDVYRHGLPEQRDLVLPMAAYALRLAAAGHLALDDVLSFHADQLRRTSARLAASETALRAANAALQRRLAELESAQRVLTQRTEALVSFQRMAEALLGAADLPALAEQVCRQARDLCAADRAILYYLRPDDQAEVLASLGWVPERVSRLLPAEDVCDPERDALTQPVVFNGWPPGVAARSPDVEGAALRAGLRVPLVVQGRPVGAMIVHSTVLTSFPPGQVALLQTFASHAALAIQRAGLIEELQAKIAALEEAQHELAVKERMERELELARQVQQSFLPTAFPAVPGCRFAAHNEPARQVGGDFYDVIALGEGRVGLVIADVSDKGMPAALYMALSRSLIRAEAQRTGSPAAVLANVNRLLLDLGEPDMFVSVFYGVLAGRTLTYGRAGHDRPLLLRGGAAHELGGSGTILGLLEDAAANLTEERLELEPGDRLILFTDGLTDIADPHGELFGPVRFQEMLLAHAALPVDVLCRQVFADLDAYRSGAEQYDDMTLLAVALE
jgi:serine phosphatase RsbU (regulator of sigma subunit)